MTLFELEFGLTAVILGLALTRLASNFHSLILAGRRVKWAPEPLLLCGIIFEVTIVVWLGQWGLRGETKTTTAMVVLEVLKMLAVFMAAAFALPDKVPEQGKLELYDYYDRTRVFNFGALILGLSLFWVDGLVRSAFDWTYSLQYLPYVIVPLYAALIFIRVRWLNVVILLGVMIKYGWGTFPHVWTQ